MLDPVLMTTLGHQVYLQDRPSVRGGTPADEVAHIAAGRATPATLVTTRIPTDDSKPGKSVDVSRASKTGVLYIDFDIITPRVSSIVSTNIAAIAPPPTLWWLNEWIRMLTSHLEARPHVFDSDSTHA